MTAPLTARNRFAADLLNVNVRLPVKLSAECAATIVDADGRDVITVDVNRTRPDAEVIKITLWTIMAINVCGGHATATATLLADYLALYGEGSGKPILPSAEKDAIKSFGGDHE